MLKLTDYEDLDDPSKLKEFDKVLVEMEFDHFCRNPSIICLTTDTGNSTVINNSSIVAVKKRPVPETGAIVAWGMTKYRVIWADEKSAVVERMDNDTNRFYVPQSSFSSYRRVDDDNKS